MEVAETGPVTVEERDGELGRDKTRIIIAHADDLCLGIVTCIRRVWD
jgi:hypothetical protein